MNHILFYIVAPRGLFDTPCLPRDTLPCIEPHNVCQEGLELCVCDENSFEKQRQCGMSSKLDVM